MHTTSVTTVILSVLLSLATAAGAVLVITGLFFEAESPRSTNNGNPAASAAQHADEEAAEANQQPVASANEELEALQRRVAELKDHLDELYVEHQRNSQEADRERHELREALEALRRNGEQPMVASEEGDEAEEEWLDERFSQHPEVSALLESEEFEDAFRATLEKIEEERRNEEIEQRLERMAQANEQTYENYLNAVTEQVGLTPVQQSSIQSLLEERAQAMLRIYDPRIPREERGSWREVHSEFDQQLQTILSPQQYQIYEDNELGNMRSHRERRRRGGNN